MITYCPSQICEKKMQCKRHIALQVFSEETKKVKSIINLDRVCPMNNYSLFIQADIQVPEIIE